MAAGDRFAYQVVNVAPRGFFRPRIDGDEVARLCNERGAQGWELVSAAGVGAHPYPAQLTLIFKRGS